MPFPPAVVESVGKVLGWKLKGAGASPAGTITYTTGGGENSRYPAGSTVRLPTIFGHRDVAFTECPGNAGYPILGSIRAVADAVSVADCNMVSNSFRPGPADRTYSFGCGQTVISGDWDGDGVDTLAIRDAATYRITNDSSGRTIDATVAFGRPDDEVYVGDWDGDGVDTLAVRRGNTFFVLNTLRSGVADAVFDYGRMGDEVHVGDWDGNGRDTFAVRRDVTFYLTNTLRGGKADRVQDYGRAGDEVYSGRWRGSGGDTLMVRRGNTFYFRYDLTSGPAHVEQDFGRATDRIVTGDWDGDGIDTVMVRR
jgi:hypothetical protein